MFCSPWVPPLPAAVRAVSSSSTPETPRVICDRRNPREEAEASCGVEETSPETGEGDLPKPATKLPEKLKGSKVLNKGPHKTPESPGGGNRRTQISGRRRSLNKYVARCHRFPAHPHPLLLFTPPTSRRARRALLASPPSRRLGGRRSLLVLPRVHVARTSQREAFGGRRRGGRHGPAGRGSPRR